MTTIKFDAQDQECIRVIQEHVQGLKPIYTVTRRVAISWALRRAIEAIKGEGSDVSAT